MPSSNLACAPRILNLVWELHQTHEGTLRVLDVGPGHGKYGVLLREYVGPMHITAIEMWEPYVVSHNLQCLYDRVLVGDVTELTDLDYDLVLMVDVIEHIPKPEALALLDRIPGWIIVCTPRDFFSNGPGLPDTEEHVSHWTVEEFAAMPRFHDYAEPEHDTLGAIIVRLRPL